MANQKQLEILKQGPEVWNQWRAERPEEVIDLSDVELKGANLNGINLSTPIPSGPTRRDLRTRLDNAELSGANLSNADFRGALLRGAHLFEADLSKANLSEANLGKARINSANLNEANLNKADLSEVGMSGSNLSKANLNNAKLQGAWLRGSDLSGAVLRRAYLHQAGLPDANLSGADFGEANLTEANLSGANFSGANLSEANLAEADLRDANFSGANLSRANLRASNLERANLFEAKLNGADLSDTDLDGASLIRADLTGANLNNAQLVGTEVNQAKISGSSVYAINVWDMNGEFAEQKNLIITPTGKSVITVDNVKIAQFIYLILNNAEIRGVIDTVTSKAVLLLGRFTEERKRVLNSLKDVLTQHGYVPILFDFEPSHNRDLTETIQLLANMSKFVIADLTDAKSIPQELSHIIPFFPSIPVQPIILASERKYAMFEHWVGYKSVLPDFSYENEAHLIENLADNIIRPIEDWGKKQDTVSALEDEIKRLQMELAKKGPSNS